MAVTSLDTYVASRPLNSGKLFTLTTFVSAALVFAAEPMMAKLLLPYLGGSPSVWNTSVAFFQVALLAGYAYAHLLQRLSSVRGQIGVHLAALAIAGLSLPLTISPIMGDPNPDRPILWLLAELTLSIGAPFALLSATAPLVQRWFATWSSGAEESGKPADAYPLYAASNLGSLAALIAYPVLIEPFSTLTAQRMGWSLGFGVFVVLVLAIVLTHRFAAMPKAGTGSAAAATKAPTVFDMTTWIMLAAAPSSLMMGVTSFLTTDIASFPFLWVVPLALYLLTFILAFQAKPLGGRKAILIVQSVAVGLCLFLMSALRLDIGWQLAIHLVAFFLTALICHQALAGRRPDVAHLTVFYLCLSLGGVLGGSFNAFLAPLIFRTVIEYPLVLILACLARPWGGLKLKTTERVLFAAAMIAALLPILALKLGGATLADSDLFLKTSLSLLIAVAGVGILLRDRALYFTLLLGALWMSFITVTAPADNLSVKRNFFGVVKVTDVRDPVLGPVRLMYHGTTIHGAQSLDPAAACQPLTYYAPQTSIGQTVRLMQQRRPAMNEAVVGLGAGTLASYTRVGDRMSFYEIDPIVTQEASNPRVFTYLSRCSKTPVAVVPGDARMTLGHLPNGQLDLLVIDAFSSDTVPAHLLTVEALRIFFSKLKPDGVLLLNLTNRHLELRDPVIAGIRQAGGSALAQRSAGAPGSVLAAAPTTAVVASMSAGSLAAFRADPRWSNRDPADVKAWTDDYSNLFGALMAGLAH